MSRIEYLKKKSEVCPLDKEELYELQKGEETMSETKTGWWSVKFDLTLDGEKVRWEDLSLDTQAHILKQIESGYWQGEIIEEGEEDE